jgi:outer membrane receptor protein involved in Fe transport
LPRHEIARVSELLQSQLLQPININPVQPSLAQRHLFILEGAGPTAPSFNEFNPLFNRNRFALQASAVAGSNDTFGEEIVHSAIWNRFSYSLGQFHFETDGFRENNDQEQDIYNLFGQASLSQNTSVLAEFRAFDVDRGDLELRFNPGDFFDNQRITDKYRGGRTGFHRVFSPGSDFIGTLVYEYEEFDTVTREQSPIPFPPPGFVLEISTGNRIENRLFAFELQQLLRRERYNLIGGAGYFYIDRKQILDTSFIPNPPQDPAIFPPEVTHEVLESIIRHANAYLYFHVRFPETVTWTIGGSADFFDDSKDDFRDRDQFNPKAGVMWTPLPGTTIRAAAFRVLRRTLPLTRQTIEPTQVAGFNQFFDDRGGTESWRYGVAAEQKCTDSLFLGVEYSQRDLDVPIQVSIPPAPTVFRQFSQKERLGRVYSYWTAHPWLSLSADYLYEHHDREGDLVPELKTHRIPLAVRFFHPSGVISMLKVTYFDQKGEFFPLNAVVPPEAGGDRFWIFDASAGYRLPNRWGIASIEARNLFNKSFKYQDMDRLNPVIWPERSVFFKITLAL